ncbi:MAG: trans-2-enoyl-CoA reductase family protein [Gemmatimonadetes bacterium]|nr:trans-2-enoyl-CoA reductase family protein [Gemmatimonadota bacterium]
MIIEPKTRGFFCLTSHPTGCEANVREQIGYVTEQGQIADGPKNVLVIGASTGYGLASRITTAFGCGAGTVGVFFEKEPIARRPATAGWYNSIAFERAAKTAGLYAKSVNGDAFSDEIKARTVDLLRDGIGPVDLVVYSLASPRRIHPKTGEVAHSVLKPIGKVYEGLTLDTDKKIVKSITIEPATEEEVAATISVMGGEDWAMWIDALEVAGLLAPGARTISFTYIGSKLTWPIYRAGTIGKAKEDLERAATALDERLATRGGGAHVCVMKALVTQSSSAIPVVPLYISLLYRVMKEMNLHEGSIEQIHRLFATHLYTGGSPPLLPSTDEHGLIRLDDREMRDEVQNALVPLWGTVSTENLSEIADFEGYQAEFLKLFGFGLAGIDYTADVDHQLQFES